MRTLCDECVPCICANVKTCSVNSISIIFHVFSSGSGVFCQDMIDSCAKVVLSDVCLAQAQSGVSDLCLSGAHRHPGKLSDDTEISNIISVCYASVVSLR